MGLLQREKHAVLAAVTNVPPALKFVTILKHGGIFAEIK